MIFLVYWVFFPKITCIPSSSNTSKIKAWYCSDKARTLFTERNFQTSLRTQNQMLILKQRISPKKYFWCIIWQFKGFCICSLYGASMVQTSNVVIQSVITNSIVLTINVMPFRWMKFHTYHSWLLFICVKMCHSTFIFWSTYMLCFVCGNIFI